MEFPSIFTTNFPFAYSSSCSQSSLFDLPTFPAFENTNVTHCPYTRFVFNHQVHRIAHPLGAAWTLDVARRRMDLSFAFAIMTLVPKDRVDFVLKISVHMVQMNILTMINVTFMQSLTNF